MRPFQDPVAADVSRLHSPRDQSELTFAATVLKGTRELPPGFGVRWVRSEGTHRFGEGETSNIERRTSDIKHSTSQSGVNPISNQSPPSKRSATALARLVAQIFNLLYRRFVIGSRRNARGGSELSSAGRMQFCDTADFKSALRIAADLRQFLSRLLPVRVVEVQQCSR